MKVLIYSPNYDTGGQGIALKRAFDDAATGWEARAVRRADSWLRYPADITWPKGASGREVRRLAAEADVIHLMEIPGAIGHLSGYGKAIVVHHLGSFFRRSPRAVSALCRSIGAVEVAGDHGLLRHGAQLLPITADLAGLAALRDEHYEPGPHLRIFHSPTSRTLKATDALIAAVRRLQRRHRIELELVERVPWRECLRRKARADVVFDQVDLGYGTNAVEAWGMGIPVVAGIADPAVRERALAEWGSLPFVEAGRDTIEVVLERLITDAALRSAMGRAGREHAERFHSHHAVLTRAIGIYDSIAERAAA